MKVSATACVIVESLETRLLLSDSHWPRVRHHVKPPAAIHVIVHATEVRKKPSADDGHGNVHGDQNNNAKPTPAPKPNNSSSSASTSTTTNSASVSSSVQAPGGPFATGSTVDTGSIAEAVLSEGNGKLLVIGHKGDLAAGQSQGTIERLNSDGSLDTSFASHGQIVSATNEAYFAAAMPDSRHFLVAGASNGDFVLRCYNLNGTPDTTFGTNGTVITDFGTASDAARAIAIGAGGMIIAGGDSGGNFAFARYEPNGQLDQNFAQGGLQLFGLGNGSNGLGAIAIQSDGKIIAAGAKGANVIAVRLTSAGEADGTFGSGGLAVIKSLTARTDLGGPDHSEGLALASDGAILVANRTAAGHFGLVRLDQNGGVDSSFGANGLASADFGGDDDADSIIAQSIGTIIVIGTSLKNGAANTAVAEFDSAGLPINSFGTGGLLTLLSGFSATQVAQSTTGGIASKALHIGDIVLRAFGTLTPDGGIIIGTTNEAVAATTSSKLRRLVVPGAVLGGQSAGTLLGTFGFVDGKTRKLVFIESGVPVTLSVTGGTAAAYQNGNKIDLTIDDVGRGVALVVSSGAKNLNLGNVTISGTLRSFSARTATLDGTLHVTGSIGRIAIGDVSGNIYSGSSIAGLTAGNASGTIFAVAAIGRLKLADVSGTIASGSGVIGSIWAASLDRGKVLSGVNLGEDGVLGGSGANADSYNAGSIGIIRIAGSITLSFIGAGVDPVDGTFGNSDDKAAAMSASVVHLLFANGADSASRFEATSFSQVRLGQSIDAQNDPRFRLLT